MPNVLILSNYNAVHIATLLFTVLASVGLWALLRRRTEKTKIAVLVTICVANLIFYFVYKWFLSRDAEFVIASGIGSFNWLNELPIQLCNINLFLIPLGVLKKNRALLGFSFFLAPLGAAMALLFPDTSFVGYSLLLPRMLGYYITHVLIVVCGVSIATLGFFRPRMNDIPRILLVFIGVVLVAHGVNMVFRVTGLCDFANYFYTYGSDISILALFWSWIPVPLLYELPALAILLAYMAILSFAFTRFGKKKAD